MRFGLIDVPLILGRGRECTVWPRDKRTKDAADALRIVDILIIF